jgi:hypothetical protein
VLGRAVCDLAGLFDALRTNSRYDFANIMKYTPPRSLDLCLVQSLAFEEDGPGFILPWLMLLQSSIEQLVFRDHLEESFHPEVWYWFCHANTFATFQVRWYTLLFLL